MLVAVPCNRRGHQGNLAKRAAPGAARSGIGWATAAHLCETRTPPVAPATAGNDDMPRADGGTPIALRQVMALGTRTCKRRAAIGVVALLAAPACYSPYVSSTPLNPEPPHLRPRKATAVEVLSSGPPIQPHVDVALLHAHVDGFHGRDELVESLRAYAADMGCDALVLGNVTWPNADATCVVYSAGAAPGSGATTTVQKR